MISSSTITTQRKTKEKKDRKIADDGKPGDKSGGAPANLPVSDEEIDKEITLKDLYKLTLSIKNGLTNEIDTQ